MNQVMKAAMISAYKQTSPEILEVPIPEPQATDVLVQVACASINPIDLKTMEGGLKMLLRYDFPLILGSDFAGTVVTVGAAVKDFKPGDRVFGRVQKNRIGTFAEYLAVTQGDIALIPAPLSFTEAAALPLVGLTSYQALKEVMQIKPGDKVLIQAGSGGIGTVAIQIAKELGAFVATTTSSRNFELVKKLGADLVIDYRQQDFTEILSDYDYVFDTQGGTILEKAFTIVKPGGQVVSITGLPNTRFAKTYGLPRWKTLAIRLASRRLNRLEKKTGVRYEFLFMRPDGRQLAQLAEMVTAGKLQPVIDRTLPFSEIKEAFAYSASGRARGKIILQMKAAPSE